MYNIRITTTMLHFSSLLAHLATTTHHLTPPQTQRTPFAAATAASPSAPSTRHQHTAYERPVRRPSPVLSPPQTPPARRVLPYHLQAAWPSPMPSPLAWPWSVASAPPRHATAPSLVCLRGAASLFVQYMRGWADGGVEGGCSPSAVVFALAPCGLCCVDCAVREGRGTEDTAPFSVHIS